MSCGRVRRLAVVLCLFAPVTVVAQSPSQRAALRAFRDDLIATHDRAAVDTVTRQLDDSIAHHRGDAMIAMRLGFAQLRLGELRQDEAPFFDAEVTFGEVSKAHPDWPLAFEGRGLARMNLARTQSAVVHKIGFLVGPDHVREAASDLARSALLDSACVDGLLKAMNLAAADHDPARGRVALEALRDVAGAPVADQPGGGTRAGACGVESRASRFGDCGGPQTAPARAG